MPDLLDMFRNGAMNPMVQYQMQQSQQQPQQQAAQPVNIDNNVDWLTQLDNAGPVAAPLPRRQSAPSYEPTTGAEMEADQKNSIDNIIQTMMAQRNKDKENDRNLGWMSFFSHLASSKNPRLLGGLGEAAGAMTDTLSKQAPNSQLLDRAMMEDQIKAEQFKQEQTLKESNAGPENRLKEAQAKYYESGGGGANRMVQAIDPSTGQAVFVPANIAMSGGYKPVTGYNTLNTTISPETIESAADALAKGASMASLGLGFGQSANKSAVLNRFSEKYPDVNLSDAQVEMTGNKAGARTVGTAGARIELASESLKSMIPLAKDAVSKIDLTQYPSINAVENAVRSGTGDPNIVALNTYLNAVQSDHAALLVRTGLSTDSAREKARELANSAMAKGQLSAYFDAVGKEIDAQSEAISNAKHVYGAEKKDVVAKDANKVHFNDLPE